MARIQGEIPGATNPLFQSSYYSSYQLAIYQFLYLHDYASVRMRCFHCTIIISIAKGVFEVNGQPRLIS